MSGPAPLVVELLKFSLKKINLSSNCFIAILILITVFLLITAKSVTQVPMMTNTRSLRGDGSKKLKV